MLAIQPLVLQCASDANAAAVDELFASHAAWMQKTHSVIEEEGKLHTLEYYVSKASELNDMMDPA